MNITLEELLRITWDVVRVVIFDLKKEIRSEENDN